MLVTQLDREPTGPELAAALGIDVSELVAMQSQSQSRQMLSLDDNGEAAFGDESISLSERLADPQAAAPDSAIRSDEDRRQLMRCLGSLPKSQATVLVLHYLQNVPLRDVADLLKVTPSRVSQLHHQALDRLRAAWDRAQKDA
jgi:RNA polymerase sigma factor for flagellar operon FliA